MPDNVRLAPSSVMVPDRDCPYCPELVAHRQQLRSLYPDWHNAPVVGFGDRAARLLIVGLAPGSRGANRTGRPFTGDKAGHKLYGALTTHGFAVGDDAGHSEDGLRLTDAFVSNGVKCAPPQHRDVSPQEKKSCRPFLRAEFLSLTQLRVILTLGRTAHQAMLELLHDLDPTLLTKKYMFGHRAHHAITLMPSADGGPRHYVMVNSYHPSPRNVNTGRLSVDDFYSLFGQIRAMVDGQKDSPKE